MRASSARTDRGPLPLVLLAASALGICAAGTGCREGAEAPVPPPKNAARLSGPTKDEVALVDGRLLSIPFFQSLRKRIGPFPAETALWIGIASLALRNQADHEGKRLDAPQALDIVLYALGERNASRSEASLRLFFPDRPSLPAPVQAKEVIDALLSRALVQRNEVLFDELKQP